MPRRSQGDEGKLSLATKALAMKGGANGEVIKPRDPASSSFYTLLLEEDEEKRMPEKAKALPQEQILEIKKWIEEGAEWPDGFEFRSRIAALRAFNDRSPGEFLIREMQLRRAEIATDGALSPPVLLQD
jgi:hypothetical protein